MTKTICLDFDGVIHSYETRWMDAAFVADEPVPGALKFIKEVLENPDYELKIFSSRSNQEGGIKAMQLWLKHWFIKEYGWEVGSGIGNQLAKTSNFLAPEHPQFYTYFPREKPSAYITIDDRAFKFEGAFPSFAVIDTFKPWNKK